jgi:hypothetical protein
MNQTLLIRHGIELQVDTHATSKPKIMTPKFTWKGKYKMNWIKELFWDSSMPVLHNLATIALAIVSTFVLYVVLLFVMILGGAA